MCPLSHPAPNEPNRRCSLSLRIPRWFAHPSIDIFISLSVRPSGSPSVLQRNFTVRGNQYNNNIPGVQGLYTTSCLDIPPYTSSIGNYAYIAFAGVRPY